MLLETYQLSKKIINQEIENIKNESVQIRNSNLEGMMMFLVSLSKLLIIKQDVVFKNKKVKSITELFPKKELDDMVFRGLFKVLDTPLDIKRIVYREKAVKIIEIEEEKQFDSGWIIDNIRDSFAHNNFEIDYENQVVHINNEQRKLVCDIDFYWLIEFSFVLSNNKIENNQSLLKLSPILYLQKPIITSMEQLLELQNKQNKIHGIADVRRQLEEFIIYMYKIEFIKSLNPWEIQKIKFGINELWSKETTCLEDMFVSNPEPIINKVLEIINEKYKDFIVTIKRVEIGKEEIQASIEMKIRELNNFYKISERYKKEIIIKFISQYYYNYQENNVIVDGLDCIMSLDFGTTNDKALKFYSDNPLEYITNQFCYKKEKLLASLYLLGTTTYTLYKEKIYDQVVNYEQIDISTFDTYDFDSPRKLKIILRERNNSLIKNQKHQATIQLKKQKLEANKQKNPEQIEPLIIKAQQTLQILQQEEVKLNEEIEELQIRVNKIKIVNNKEYVEVSSVEFFRHLRNALAHTWIYYDDTTSKNLMNRIVEIRDYNDDNELVYICRAPYKDWIKIFNSKVFEDAIKNYNQENDENNTLSHTLI